MPRTRVVGGVKRNQSPGLLQACETSSGQEDQTLIADHVMNAEEEVTYFPKTPAAKTVFGCCLFFNK